MTTTTILVIVLTVLLIVGIVTVLARQGHPEQAATHSDEGDASGGPTPGDYPSGSRPAGPGAEGMNAPQPGFVSPNESPRIDPD